MIESRMPVWTWDDMLAEFRALGGIADNVVQGSGRFGRGLFPIDPTRPVTLHVPERLLIPARHVRQDGDDLVVAGNSGVDARLSDFFTRFERNFSWGLDGRAGVESFISQIGALPGEAKRALGGAGVPTEKFANAGDRFIASRAITVGGERRLMTLIELLNHSASAPGFDTRDGVRVSGVFSGEVLVSYSVTDSWHRFFTQHFVSDEGRAFSLPCSTPLANGKTLVIGDAFGEKQARADGAVLPILRTDGDRILVSHVLLGDERMPRRPRTIFRALFPALAPDTADEIFQWIASANMRLLVDLLGMLDGHDGEFAVQLRAVLRLQLKGIAHAFGVDHPGSHVV